MPIIVDGQQVTAAEGEMLAAALLRHGLVETRRSIVSGTPRGPFCLMGACLECTVTVDGIPGVQTCLAPVVAGMTVELQRNRAS